MMIKKGRPEEIIPYEIILRYPTDNPDKNTVDIEYCFTVQYDTLTGKDYDRLFDIIKKDFPWLKRRDVWTQITDFSPGYSFYATYEEFEKVLKKYGLAHMLE